MAEKQDENQHQAPRPLSLRRLLLDQARVTDDVLQHQYEGSGTTDDPYIVSYIPQDAGNPFTWDISFRWFITVVVAIECLVTAFASSAYSGKPRALTLLNTRV